MYIADKLHVCICWRKIANIHDSPQDVAHLLETKKHTVVLVGSGRSIGFHKENGDTKRRRRQR